MRRRRHQCGSAVARLFRQIRECRRVVDGADIDCSRRTNQQKGLQPIHAVHVDHLLQDRHSDGKRPASGADALIDCIVQAAMR